MRPLPYPLARAQPSALVPCGAPTREAVNEHARGGDGLLPTANVRAAALACLERARLPACPLGSEARSLLCSFPALQIWGSDNSLLAACHAPTYS
jgi:hypothetical protein